MLLLDTKVSMIIMSLLSDAQELIGMNGHESTLHQKINFAKWLVCHYKDTNVELTNEQLNAEWDTYIQRFPLTKMAMSAE